MAEKEIGKLLEKDLIEPARSAWLSPVVLVLKPDGKSVRFCIDFRKSMHELNLMHTLYPKLTNLLNL